MRTRLRTTIAVSLALTLAMFIMVSCSDGDDSTNDDNAATTTDPASSEFSTPASTTTTQASSDVAESEPSADEGIEVEEVVRARDAVMPDPDKVEAVARAYCEAWTAPRDVDVMVAGLTDDVVIYDGVTGERYEGSDAAGTYTAEAMTEFDTAHCGPAIVGGDWAAITYTLSSTGGGEGIEGIAAIRVFEDSVDWHLTYYTPADEAQPPGESSISDDQTASLTYCEAFADPAHDPDVILATMTDEPEIYGIPNDYSAVGVEAIKYMIAYQVVPTDVNSCGYQGTLVHGGWEGGTSSTVNESFGLWLEGVSVIEVADGKVNRHYIHTSTFDGAEQFGDRWGVTD